MPKRIRALRNCMLINGRRPCSSASALPLGTDQVDLPNAIALDADTGQYLWHYQQTPGDAWDYNSSTDITLATLPIVLHPGMRIGQMSFERMSSPAERPYGSAGLGSHYQGQRGAAAAHTLTR